MNRITYDRHFMADFETTVYDGQERTDVWAFACVELFTDDVVIYGSIQETLDYFASFKENICVYFHNLKFDGTFIVTELFRQGYKHAYRVKSEAPYKGEWADDACMPKRSFKYVISDRGQWYTILIRFADHYLQIRDSLKLIPISVKRIGESFGTKHKKLEMEYKGLRYPGCEITESEKHYIRNDVLVVKEALEIMFKNGHNRLTIGSCCLEEFMKGYDKEEYSKLFPDLTEIPVEDDFFRKQNIDEKMPVSQRKSIDVYVRKSYRGGWCYLVPEKARKIHRNGITLDVNSLYPSVMHSESGNRYPIGLPKFWKGDYIPDMPSNAYYFVRVQTRFKIRPGYLPFIQIKNSIWYKGTEMLTTSDVWDEENQVYRKGYILHGIRHEYRPILTFTCTDWELVKEHYYLYDTEILDGCYFATGIGLFDDYLNKYKHIKLTSTGAVREIAKLFQNNLYGKEASSTNSSYKVCYIGEQGELKFKTVLDFQKKAGYIPIGSAITSYARNFEIRAAQQNYYGPENPGFIYADTDSLHMDISIDEVKGVVIDKVNYCCFKHESNWKIGFFTRQKTYLEIMKENGKHVFDIKCAGMQARVKDNYEEKVRTGELRIKDFVPGLELEGRLAVKRIRGGTLLVDDLYKMKEG